MLGLRRNTGWADGCWHLPAGHGEAREAATATLVREAAEEIGIVIDPTQARFVHLAHHWTDSPRIAIFFEVTRWQGEPINNEPHKCAEWRWCSLAHLPEPMIGYAKAVVGDYLNGDAYSEPGWRDQ